ncbi:MAG: SprT-like domain-containing protein [Chlamydiales bacterium]
MSPEEFKFRLTRQLNYHLDLRINDNRFTMLNLLERKRNYARLSLHRMFLKAPDPVVSAIAHYVRGRAKNQHLQNTILRRYIQENLPHYAYTQRAKKETLAQAGCIYNLKTLFDELNHHYFNDELDLQITWYGKKGRRNRSQLVFGQYQESLKLIKINRILDDPFFPDYFISFIVYHEMLHAVVPGFVDERGWYRTHGAAFKARERHFKQYNEAIAWEKKNKVHFFKKK